MAVLGNLFLTNHMKIALLADAHSNLEALGSVLKSLHDEAADRIIFLGDIVGYGADPAECIRMIAEASGDILAGNHDWAAAGRSSSASFNPAAREAIDWTIGRLSARERAFLAALPLAREEHSLVCVHATPSEPAAWDYIFSLDDARHNFEAFSRQVCCVAHSHRPIIFARSGQGVLTAEKQTSLRLQDGWRYIINVGSVGQPRDGDPRACYGLYDTETSQYRLVRVPYPIARAQQKIIKAGLPALLAARLGVGS
jgi:diadenosine tetraphosphatase ApaH/serine/threonine PP2A family protein phosphatase